MTPQTLDVLLPFWGMAGGVIKVLDYTEHAAKLGIETTMWAPPRPDASDPVFTLPVLDRVLTHEKVTVRPLDELSLHDGSTVLFTEVGHHGLIEAAAPSALGGRLIHLVQGTRHANPRWNSGVNYRLLHRPMTRIAVSDAVDAAIRPHLNGTYPCVTIPNGHDWHYFTGRPAMKPEDGPELPRLRVLYTTWKSDLGPRIAQRVASSTLSTSVSCIGVTTALTWPALRNRYHGADVFICTPGPEEGFYLPGLEAMAAQTAVISAIVGGNAEYVRPDENAIVVPYDDVDAHVAAIERLVTEPALRERLVAAAPRVLESHTLDAERASFADLLGTLDEVEYDFTHGAPHR